MVSLRGALNFRTIFALADKDFRNPKKALIIAYNEMDISKRIQDYYHNEMLIRIKYPKFTLLLIIFILAYFFFQTSNFPPLHHFLISTGYFGIFVGGLMFAYGFTAPFATVFFLILANHTNPFIAAPLAGFGAMIGNLVIFKFIQRLFSDEIEKLSREKIVIQINCRISSVKRYLLPVVAGLIIASPLPSEIGVFILAASRTVSTKVFVVVSLLLNTFGILAVLLIGRVI